MITRKVDRDDAQAGFTYGWVKKIAQNVEKLKVICLEKGNLKGLPDNLEVFSMGKEKGKNRLKEFIRFQIGAFKFIFKVDKVFCHMNPEYTILIFPYAKIFRKRIVSWYSHKAINWKVKIMHFLADRIVTPTKDSFGIESKKKIVVGHGIDTDLFKPRKREKNDILKIISVGRISPIKDYVTLIKAIGEVKKHGIIVRVEIVGGWDYSNQERYLNKLKELVKKYHLGDQVWFIGAVRYKDLLAYYQEAGISVNLCPTGSPDKAVLEAMACGLSVIVANQTLKEDFGPYAHQLIFEHGNVQDLADKIITLVQSGQMEEIGLYLRKQVVKNHNLDKLVNKIIKCFH